MVRDKKPLNERSRESDFGTPERLQHTAGIRYERTSKKLGSKKRLRITQQTPLDRMKSRDQITQRQYDAGEKLYTLFYKSGKLQRLTSNYDAVIVDGGKRGGETASEAVKRRGKLRFSIMTRSSLWVETWLVCSDGCV